MKYLKGRSARQQRRREIISRLFELAQTLYQQPGTVESDSAVKEHRTLLLELVELIAVDDNKIRTRK